MNSSYALWFYFGKIVILAQFYLVCLFWGSCQRVGVKWYSSDYTHCLVSYIYVVSMLRYCQIIWLLYIYLWRTDSYINVLEIISCILMLDHRALVWNNEFTTVQFQLHESTSDGLSILFSIQCQISDISR